MEKFSHGSRNADSDMEQLPLLHADRFSSNTALFEEIVSRYPRKIALRSRCGILTFYDLNARSNQLAAHLRMIGVGHGHIVTVNLDRGIQYVVAALAIWKASAVYLPCDPSLPPNRVKHMITDSKSSCLITFKSCHAVGSLALANLTTLFLDDIGLVKTIKGHPTTNTASLTCHESIAYIIYTSGSTGNPKGVTITHGNVLNLVEDIRQSGEIEPTDTVLLFSPFTFDASIRDINGTLLQGASLYVPQQDEVLPGNLLSTISEQLITNSVITPSVLRSCVYTPLPQLQTMVLAGEAITDSLIAIWGPGRKLINAYGPSEATVCSTKQVYINGISSCHSSASIGKPILNTTITLLNENDCVVEPGEIGEICITGPGVSLFGYLNNPRLNEQCFRELHSAKRSYKTGDMGRMLPKGEIEYVGRKASVRQVKLHGQRIELQEIESVLRKSHHVFDAAVVLVGVEPSCTLRAYVIPNQSDLVNKDALKIQLDDLLRLNLPSYAIPSSIDLISRFPLTTNNKLDKSALARSIIPKSIMSSRPLSQLELQICKAILEALNLSSGTRVAPDTTYAELGGTSLLATLVLRRINHAVGCDIQFQQFFRQNVTIQQIAELVLATRSNESSVTCADLSNRVQLAPDIAYAVSSSQNRQVIHVLLTGATGFLGSHILAELLAVEHLQISCIVRAQTSSIGLLRIKKALQNWDIWEESFANRVQVVCGDVSKPFLGINVVEYVSLAASVDTICHSAAAVSFIAPLADLERANVAGTVEVLRFATAITQKRLTYISSLSVFFGAGRNQHYGTETTVQAMGTDIVTGYAQSKWLSEQIVLTYQELGGSVLVLRPGRLLGSTRNYKCPPDDLNVRFIASILELGVAPELESLMDSQSGHSLDWHLDLTPVDYCAQAIHSWMLQGRIGIHHILNQETITFRSLLEYLEAMGQPISRIPYQDWQKLITQSTHLGPLAPIFCNCVSSADRRSTFEVLLHSPIFQCSSYASVALTTDYDSASILSDSMELLSSYLKCNRQIFAVNRGCNQENELEQDK